MQEVVENITLEKLKPFPNHPFKIREDEAMMETVESVKSFGVLQQPVIVRKTKDGDYEILSGHRRKRACELAGRKTMPVIVRELSDDAAVIFMVDSNLQRENILPSERAAAYKMKLEAMKRQGMRTDLTSPQVASKSKLRSDDQVAKESNISGDTLRRYIRLTELQPELIKMVDEKKIAFTPAVELSYLKPDEQRMLIDTIESEQSTPSLSQAQRMKKLSQNGELDCDKLFSIMTELKKPERNEIKLSYEVLEKYFPKNYTPQKMQEVIIKLLESWQRKRQMNHER